MADQPIKNSHVAEPKGKGRTSDGAAKVEEARHKVPQQCLRGPSIVARKAGNTSTGTSLARDPDRAAMVVEVIPSTQGTARTSSTTWWSMRHLLQDQAHLRPLAAHC